MRGAAIGLVFLFHALWPSFGGDAPAWAGWHRAWPLPLPFYALLPAYLGWSGVALFFVVSGFCIHLSHERAAPDGWGRFFQKRFFRIYPPYLTALLFFALVWPATRLSFDGRHEVDQLLTHLLLVHNGLGPGFIYGINPAFWSIGVEVQLYLLYPLLLAVVRRGGWGRALWLTGSVEVGGRVVFGFFGSSEPGRLWLLGDPLMYWLSWTLGAALADRWLRGEALRLSPLPAWGWALLAVGSYFFQPLYGFGFLLWALASTTMLAEVLAHSGDGGGSFWTNAWLGKIGVISYSVYLLHQPLEEMLGGWARGWFGNSGTGSWLAFMTCLASAPVVLLISWGFYRGVERPSVALGKWWGRWEQLRDEKPRSEASWTLRQARDDGRWPNFRGRKISGLIKKNGRIN